jgi:hypothetical protein
LALGVAIREAAVLIAILLMTFLVYSLLHLHEADCECFLFPVAMPTFASSWWPPMRDLLLLVISVQVICKRT